MRRMQLLSDIYILLVFTRYNFGGCRITLWEGLGYMDTGSDDTVNKLIRDMNDKKNPSAAITSREIGRTWIVENNAGILKASSQSIESLKRNLNSKKKVI